MRYELSRQRVLNMHAVNMVLKCCFLMFHFAPGHARLHMPGPPRCRSEHAAESRHTKEACPCVNVKVKTRAHKQSSSEGHSRRQRVQPHRQLVTRWHHSDRRSPSSRRLRAGRSRDGGARSEEPEHASKDGAADDGRLLVVLEPVGGGITQGGWHRGRGGGQVLHDERAHSASGGRGR